MGKQQGDQVSDKAIQKKDEAQTPADRALGWMMAQVEKRGAKLENLLHPDMPLERFTESCRLAFAKNPDLTDLGKTDGASLMQALMLGARSGLDVHGHYGHLVSFQNKKFEEKGKDVWKAVIVYMPDWKGLLATGKAAGAFLDANGVLVHEADHFVVEKGEVKEHIPFIRRKPSDVKGGIIAAYTRVLLPSGAWVDKGLMLLEDIERIEGGIKAKNGPWGGSHRGEMIRKSSFRQAWKWLGPATADRAVAMRLAALEEAEAIEGEYTVTTPAIPAPTSGVERTKQAARKSLAPKSQETDTRDFINPEPTEEEKAAILAAEMEPGSES
jgi:recombinational DNA repair protein RecT